MRNRGTHRALVAAIVRELRCVTTVSVLGDSQSDLVPGQRSVAQDESMSVDIYNICWDDVARHFAKTFIKTNVGYDLGQY